ncbi:MAG: ABC transporter permease [Acidothermus sp.]|nr:ABC transporter permease [Acidothermus sp.]
MLRASIRNLVAHKVRLVLTVLAVMIGVAFLVGTQIFTDTVKATFDELLGRTSKNLSVVVREKSDFGASDFGASRQPIPESLVATVEAVPGVAHAVGSVTGFATLVTADGRAVVPKVVGPPTLATSWTPSNLSSLRFVAGRGPRGPGEVAIDKAAADRFHLGLGDRVTVQTEGAPMAATVVGIVTVGASSNLAGAVLSVFDPATAQRVVGRPGYVNEIDVEAEPGITQDELAARISAVLPAGVEAVTAKTVTKENTAAISKALGFFNTFLAIFAGVALFVGLFIIVNTFTMLVAQRTRELALLRAVGASRAQITLAVLGEAAAVGGVAATLGIAFGTVVAFGVRGLLHAVGVGLPSGPLVMNGRTVLLGYLVGILVTVSAALGPALRAARIPPVAALRDVVALPVRSLRIRAIVGAALLGIGAMVAVGGWLAGSKGGGAAARVGIGAVALIVGMWLASPVLSRPVIHALGAPLVAVRGVIARLARSNAIRNPRRTAATASALMIGLALVSMLAVLTSSTKASIASLVDRNLGADFVLQSEGFDGFSPDVAHRAATLPGVETVAETRVGRARVNGKTEFLAAVSPTIGSVVGLTMTSGSLTTLDDGALLVSRSRAQAAKLTTGSTVEVEFPDRTRERLRIGGVYEDNALLANGGAGYLVSLSTYERHYAVQRDVIVYVEAAPGHQEEVSAGLARALQPYPQIHVRSQAEYKKSILTQVDQIVGLITGLLGVALVIAVLGIANTLALSVYERIREIGLLRAVGMTRRHVRSMVRLEALVIAVFGALVGVVLGSLIGLALVGASGNQIDHLVVPFGQLAVYVLVAAILGLLAAAGPAWQAGRRPVLTAIATE